MIPANAFDRADIEVCSEHGEYTQEDQRRVGIEQGCPICFQIDLEADREEMRLD